MSDNEDRLKNLESGNERPPAKANPPVTNQSSAPNDDKLGQLQSGAPAGTQSTAPVTSQFSSGATPPPTQSPKPPNPLHGGVPPSNPPSVSRWIWIGGAAAVVVGALVLVVVGGLLSTSESEPGETGSVSESIAASTSEDISFQGPPEDIPALASLVTKSTVLIDCPTGLGTGFLLDVEPLTGVGGSRVIVTNQHVIEGCEGSNDLTVSNATSRSRGSVVTFDKDLDLAIVEAPLIEGQALAVGSVPEIGQWAMAVGNPEGITDTVTVGNITNVKLDEDFILSDVLLGPGNSGGPLVDNQGKVLGINTAVLKTAEGFSFSIPVENLCLLLKCP
jgi:S1-C subfamily serine protease